MAPHRRATDIDQFNVESVFLKKACVERHPDVDLAGADRGDGNAKLFDLAFGAERSNRRHEHHETDQELREGNSFHRAPLDSAV
jgi:hypothetical protein